MNHTTLLAKASIMAIVMATAALVAAGPAHAQGYGIIQGCHDTTSGSDTASCTGKLICPATADGRCRFQVELTGAATLLGGEVYASGPYGASCRDIEFCQGTSGSRWLDPGKEEEFTCIASTVTEVGPVSVTCD